MLLLEMLSSSQLIMMKCHLLCVAHLLFLRCVFCFLLLFLLVLLYSIRIYSKFFAVFIFLSFLLEFHFVCALFIIVIVAVVVAQSLLFLFDSILAGNVIFFFWFFFSFAFYCSFMQVLLVLFFWYDHSQAKRAHQWWRLCVSFDVELTKWWSRLAKCKR